MTEKTKRFRQTQKVHHKSKKPSNRLTGDTGLHDSEPAAAFYGGWLKIADVMNKDIVSISSSHSAAEAVRIMVDKNISCILVIDEEKLVGILTETDFLRKVVAQGQNLNEIKVAQIMSCPVESTSIDKSIMAASSIMEKKCIKRLPIIENEVPVGIVTQTDLSRIMASHIWSSINKVMTADIITIESNASLVQASEIMTSNKISSLVVLRDKKVAGVLTEKDVLRKVLVLEKDPSQIRVEEVMSGSVITIRPDYSAFSAGKMMEKMHVRRLVVMEDKKLCGIITQTDIFRAAKKALEEAKEENRAILEKSPSGICTIDLDGNITYANSTSMKLLQVDDLKEFLDKPFLPERFWCNSADRNRLLKKLKEGDILIRELTLKTGEGKKIYVTLFSTFTTDTQGRVDGFQCVFYDITAKKQLAAQRETEQALKESEERFRNLMEHLPGVSIQGYNTDGTVFYWNKTSEEIYGYTAQEAIGKNLGELIIPDDLKPLFRKGLKAGKNTERSGEFLPSGELMLLHKDGHLVPVYSIHTVVNVEGKEPLLFCIDVDLSERKKVEEQLRQRLDFETLISAISTEFVNLEINQIDNAINNALEKIGTFTGADRSYVFLFSEDGKKMSNTHEWCADGIKPDRDRLQDLLVEKYPWLMEKFRKLETVNIPCVAELKTEASYEKQDFQNGNVKSLACVCLNCGRKLIGVLGFDSVEKQRQWPKDTLATLEIVGEIFSNALQRKQTEENLRRAKQRAEEAQAEIEKANRKLGVSVKQANILAQEAVVADLAKSQFLANMSHEIRTPLNAIIGFSEVLSEAELVAEEKNHIAIIRESAENLLLLIKDILDFSRIEAGKLDVEIEDCSLEQLLAIIESLVRPQAVEKGLRFEVLQLSKLPATIRTDPIRLRQCLINIINNAVGFTEQGYVYVNVSVEQIDDKPYVRFDVEDTGIGISTDQHEKIFEEFVQSDGGTTRRYGGAGLGLAITKRLANLLGGEISVKSEPGKGSTFSLVIPAGIDIESQPIFNKYEFASESESKPETLESHKFTGRVLVVEDSKTNQTLISLLLRRLGLDVTIAEDGALAVDKALSEEFDLIFMDIQMPNMNGYDATRMLRKKGLKTPIVALTAHAMKGDREKCLSAGCDDYMSKPIDRKILVEMITKYLPAQSNTASGKIDSVRSQVDELGELCCDLALSATGTEESDKVLEANGIIDWASIIKTCGNEDVVREVVEMFLKDSPRCIKSIAESVQAGNPKHIRMYAHSLKGAAVQIGAKKLAEKAYRLECAGRDKKTAQAGSLFNEVQGEFDKLMLFLSQPNWIKSAKKQHTETLENN